MAQLQFGVAFDQPVKQTILPIVIMPHGTMHGFFYIAETEFDGTETEFALTEGNVPIMTVQKGPHNIDGTGFDQGTEQFMAAVWDVTVEAQRPWIGYLEWINNESTGMYARWTLPSQFVHLIENWGALYGSFKVRLDRVVITGQPDIPTPPTGSNGAMSWVSQINWDAISQDCAFFDLNWFDLFQASYNKTYQCPDGSTAVVPISITPLTAPPQWKVMVVRAGTNMEVAQGGAVYNTLRFIRILSAPPGDYTFTFRIVDQYNQTTTVTMTLTVVAR